MKIITGKPPNYGEIEAVIDPPPQAIFCYGDTIYNPSGKDISPDIEKHEQIHQQQQAQYASPQMWWFRYLIEPEFRLQQELQAYAVQYNYVRSIVTNSDLKLLLFEIAQNLASMYKLDLTHQQAEVLITRAAKKERDKSVV